MAHHESIVTNYASDFKGIIQDNTGQISFASEGVYLIYNDTFVSISLVRSGGSDGHIQVDVSTNDIILDPKSTQVTFEDG